MSYKVKRTDDNLSKSEALAAVARLKRRLPEDAFDIETEIIMTDSGAGTSTAVAAGGVALTLLTGGIGALFFGANAAASASFAYASYQGIVRYRTFN